MCAYELQDDSVKHTKHKAVDGGNKLPVIRLRGFLLSFFESWSTLRHCQNDGDFFPGARLVGL